MEQITRETNIRDIIAIDEGLADVLMDAGMHCLGCVLSHFENLEQACAAHGIDCDTLVENLNAYLANKE